LSVVVVVLAVLSPSLDAAERVAGRIFGRALGPGEDPLSGVVVTIKELDRHAVTDSDGVFAFDGVAEGEYTLVFSQGEHSQEIAEVPVVAGATTVETHQFDWTVSFADTIVVEAASRRVERLVDAPAAVTIITSNDIEREASHGQLPKVVEFVAGADVTQSGLYDFNLNARGFNSTLTRRVLTLIDGRDPSGTLIGAQEWAAITNLDDVAGIEFVRGPGSALYGANAYNGVLNITSRQARYNEGGDIRLSGGELSTASADLRWAQDLGDDWYLKVTGSYLQGEDFAVSRTAELEYPGLPYERIPLNGEDTDIASVGVRLDKHFANGHMLTLDLGTAQIENTVTATGIGRLQVEQSDRPYARFGYNTNHFNVLAYYDARDATQRSLSSGDLLHDDSYKLHLEVQGHTDFAGGRGQVIGGLSYRNENVDTANDLGQQTIISEAQDVDLKGVFGQVEYSFNDQFRLVAAGRWDDSDLHDPQVSPKASLVYTVNQNHGLRLTYNEAFQTPNYLEYFLDLNAAAPVSLAALEQALSPYLGGVPLGWGSIPVMALGNNDLEVEEIITYEIGYTGIMGPMLLNLDVYHSEMENFVTDLLPGVNPTYAPYAPSGLPAELQAIILGALQQAAAANPQLAQLLPLMTNAADGSALFALSYANAGRVDSDGVELAVSVFPTAAWTIDLSYAWMDFEVKEQELGDVLLPNAPEHRIMLGLGYAAERFDVRLKYRWVDDFDWASGVFVGPVESYNLVDLGGNVRLTDHWGLGLYVSNLLDEEHYQMFGGDLLRRRGLANVNFTW
jgi:iron complex outermembrane receptor protein